METLGLGLSDDGGNHSIHPTHPVAAAETIIPLLPPPLPPRVLDYPVRHLPKPQNRVAVGAVADEQHPVVDESLPADERAGDAADVGLHEDGVEAHRERAAPDQVRRDLVLVQGDRREIGNPNGDFVGFKPALGGLPGVGVGALLLQASGRHYVLVGVGH